MGKAHGMTTDTHKRGDSFERTVTIPVDFADGYFVGWTATSQIRTNGDALVAGLVCTWADPVTTRSLEISATDTSAWPIAPLNYDVQFTRTADGYVVSTTSMQLDVIRDQTHA